MLRDSGEVRVVTIELSPETIPLLIAVGRLSLLPVRGGMERYSKSLACAPDPENAEA